MSAESTTLQQTTFEQASPRLSHQWLTVMLICMCLVPVIIITVLWQILPPVEEGKLQVEVATAGLPPIDYYKIPYYQRPPVTAVGRLLVTNVSEQDWTHLNIQINKDYSIYDIKPIAAGATATFDLDRFITRSGAKFSLQYNELRSVKIYARRPTRDRATFYHVFPTVEAGTRK